MQLLLKTLGCVLLIWCNLLAGIKCKDVDQTEIISYYESLSHDVNIEENEMSPVMTVEVVAKAVEAFTKHNDKEMVTKEIKDSVEEEYNGTWLVVVDGKNSSLYIGKHFPGTYIKFSYKNHTIIMLKPVKILNMIIYSF
jgi:hypothetical protein